MQLLLDEAFSGRVNMARDEALLAAGVATVRLYGWRPATVSLGRAQGPEAVDAAVAAGLGVDVVRRSTGGGAILHNESEVTYAVVLPLDRPGLARDVPGSFAYVSAGVVHALRSLGVPAEVGSSVQSTREDLCYLRHQGTNVFVRGRKISGGAQRRTARAVLQHGTVIVHRDEQRMAALFRAGVDDICRRVTSLVEEGVRVERPELVGALVRGFEAAFGERLVRVERPGIVGAAAGV